MGILISSPSLFCSFNFPYGPYLGEMSKLILLILLLGLAESFRRKEKKTETKYSVKIITGSGTDDGTTGTVTLTLEAALLGNQVTQVLDNSDNTYFKAGATDTFEFTSTTNIRRVNCVTLTVTSDDAWMVNTVIVGSDRQKQDVHIYNKADQWMSTDAGEGVEKLRMCSQGLYTYKVEIKTADEDYAGSGNIRAQITFSGDRSSTSGILDDFTKGETKTIEIRNMVLSECVTITAGADDAWLIDWTKVERMPLIKSRFGKDIPALEFVNDKKVWLSSDDSEGKNKIEFCKP